jgi:hypothetical protein
LGPFFVTDPTFPDIKISTPRPAVLRHVWCPCLVDWSLWIHGCLRRCGGSPPSHVIIASTS